MDDATRGGRAVRPWFGAIAGTAFGLGLILVALAAVPMLAPHTGAWAAETLRKVLGPGPVATLESISFRLQDIWNGWRYRLSGGQPQIAWGNAQALTPPLSPAAEVLLTPTAQPMASPPPTPNTPPLQNTGIAPALVRPTAKPSRVLYKSLPTATHSATPQPTSSPRPTAAPSATIQPSPSAVAWKVEEGWQAFGPLAQGVPVMARSSVKPDPARPYAQVALVRIDLSQVRLNLVPGSVEPVAAKGVPAFSRSGTIPLDAQRSGLLAAFNGGFRTVHGAYGMMVAGRTILPPSEGIATLALYRDGRVEVGAWGREITPTAELEAYRQNCPLLVDAGQMAPSITNGKRQDWGYTIGNLDTTWRSGLGITRDRRYLLYAAGPSLTVEALTRALLSANAHYAMQLDINPAYTRFVTFRPAADANARYKVVAEKLLDQMPAGPTQFLAPYEHDFVYLSAAWN